VLTEHDIEALYEVRRVLEGLVGEMFALRATAKVAEALRRQMDVMEHDYLHGTLLTRERSKDDFYRLLLQGASNAVLEEELHGIHTRIGLFRRLAFVDEDRVELSMAELRHIVDAAATQRDPRAARDACEHHIRLAGELAVIAYRQWRDSEPSTPQGGASRPVALSQNETVRLLP
jgi:DNA-binding GntR family transcriptional regulator